MSKDNTSPPGGTGIRVIKSADDILVIEIPPGGRGARSFGIFALLWNAVAIPLSISTLFGPDGSDLGFHISLFQAVGLGMAFAWMKMRFTHTLVGIKPHELTVQRRFLGRKKLSRTELDEHSNASLKVSYRSNKKNVYCVCVAGVDREEKFGTRLSQPEKDWMVHALNRIIAPHGVQPASQSSRWPDYCADCGTQLLTGDEKCVCPDCGRIYREGDVGPLADAVDDTPAHARQFDVEAVPTIAPHELSPDSRIVVEIDEAEHLQFWYPVNHLALKGIGCVLMVFSVIWLCIVAGMLFIGIMAQNQGPADKAGGIVIAAVFGLIGLLPLGLSLGVFRARVVFDLDDQKFTQKFRAGFLRFGRSISTASIQDIGIGRLSPSMESTSPTTPAGWSRNVGMVYSPEHNLPVTLNVDRQLNLDATGLIRYQLVRMGHTFADG